MNLLLYEYPTCSTCKKTKVWLDENHILYDTRNIKTEAPTVLELEEYYRKSGLPLKRFFNTSGLVYKELGLKDKLVSMSEAEQLKLLSSNGMLIKRPMLIGNDFVLVGFREKEWQEKLVKIKDAI